MKPHKRIENEYQTLRRTGFPRKSKLRKLWWAYENMSWPSWLPEFLDDVAHWLVTRTICLVHNHTPMTEMDNKTIVCAVCGKKLGEH